MRDKLIKQRYNMLRVITCVCLCKCVFVSDDDDDDDDVQQQEQEADIKSHRRKYLHCIKMLPVCVFSQMHICV